MRQTRHLAEPIVVDERCRWWDQYMLLPWPDTFGMLVVGMFKVPPLRHSAL